MQTTIGGAPTLAAQALDEISTLAARAAGSVVQIWRGRRGAGAGIIVGEGGQLLTSDHVIARARGPLRVRLADGDVHEAEVVARAPELDLALLSIAARELPAVPLGRSARLRVGDLLIAIGHPWGEPNVVTVGIVSGLGSVHVGRNGHEIPAIRSDVRLAPGNSGGPLLDARGAVVGINSMIFGGDLSIAIPIDGAREWLAKRESRAA